jgi:hypothetical protein
VSRHISTDDVRTGLDRYRVHASAELSIMRLVDNIITNTTSDRKDSDGF